MNLQKMWLDQMHTKEKAREKQGVNVRASPLTSLFAVFFVFVRGLFLRGFFFPLAWVSRRQSHRAALVLLGSKANHVMISSLSVSVPVTRDKFCFVSVLSYLLP